MFRGILGGVLVWKCAQVGLFAVLRGFKSDREGVRVLEGSEATVRVFRY